MMKNKQLGKLLLCSCVCIIISGCYFDMRSLADDSIWIKLKFLQPNSHDSQFVLRSFFIVIAIFRILFTLISRTGVVCNYRNMHKKLVI